MPTHKLGDEAEQTLALSQYASEMLSKKWQKNLV